MNFGLDFSEILVILVLILLFFGSKELPRFFREGARFIGKLRMYTEKVRREIQEISRLDEPVQSFETELTKKKEDIRKRVIAAREGLGAEERTGKSRAICKALASDPQFARAKAIVMYVEVGAEVATRECIREMFASGKRVLLTYGNEDGSLGIGEITDIDRDLVQGPFKVWEPAKSLRDNFFKTDVQFVVCPGVAYDIYGGRLGRGRGSYDRFCKDLKHRVPLFGLAFDCQILDKNDKLPFDYHDIVMDQVITESGYLIKKEEAAPETPAPIEPPVTPAG
jgi:5-formyltetrahydrofolate cyclo-ligase